MPQEFISVISLMLVAVLCVWCFKRVNLPPILAYLMAGFLVGPAFLNLFDHPEQMHVLAEIGIVWTRFGTDGSNNWCVFSYCVLVWFFTSASVDHWWHVWFIFNRDCH